MIATYALCGFANIGSIGVQIGGLSALAPKRRSDLASVAVRAMVAGTIACFMTACIAGKMSFVCYVALIVKELFLVSPT